MKNKVAIALLLLTTQSVQSALPQQSTKKEAEALARVLISMMLTEGPGTTFTGRSGDKSLKTLQGPHFTIEQRVQGFTANVMPNLKVDETTVSNIEILWKKNRTKYSINIYYSPDFSQVIECVHETEGKKGNVCMYSSKLSKEEVCEGCRKALDLVPQKQILRK